VFKGNVAGGAHFLLGSAWWPGAVGCGYEWLPAGEAIGRAAMRRVRRGWRRLGCYQSAGGCDAGRRYPGEEFDGLVAG
jgi:hypothetical protein